MDHRYEDGARGMERKWIMAVRRLFRRMEASRAIDHIVHLLSYRPCTIASDNALEGVRYNGTQRLVTAMRVKRELVLYRNSLLENARRLAVAADRTSEEIDALMNEWDINWDECPACDGLGGYLVDEIADKVVYGDDCADGYWQDCENCNGRGMCEGH